MEPACAAKFVQRNWCVNFDKSFGDPPTPRGMLEWGNMDSLCYILFVQDGFMWPLTCGQHLKFTWRRIYTHNLGSLVLIWACLSGLISSIPECFTNHSGKEFDLTASDTKRWRAQGTCSSRCCDRDLLSVLWKPGAPVGGKRKLKVGQHNSIFHVSWASWEINKDSTCLRTYAIWH